MTRGQMPNTIPTRNHGVGVNMGWRYCKTSRCLVLVMATMRVLFWSWRLPMHCPVCAMFCSHRSIPLHPSKECPACLIRQWTCTATLPIRHLCAFSIQDVWLLSHLSPRSVQVLAMPSTCCDSTHFLARYLCIVVSVSLHVAQSVFFFFCSKSIDVT